VYKGLTQITITGTQQITTGIYVNLITRSTVTTPVFTKVFFT